LILSVLKALSFPSPLAVKNLKSPKALKIAPPRAQTTDNPSRALKQLTIDPDRAENAENRASPSQSPKP
jgi:hypothetical protein